MCACDSYLSLYSLSLCLSTIWQAPTAALRRVRQWEAATELWLHMRHVGTKADSSLSHLVTTSLAGKYLARFGAQKLVHPGGFWNMLTSASGRGGAWEKTLVLQQVLLLDRVAANEITRSAAVRAMDEFS